MLLEQYQRILANELLKMQYFAAIYLVLILQREIAGRLDILFDAFRGFAGLMKDLWLEMLLHKPTSHVIVFSASGMKLACIISDHSIRYMQR